MDQELQYLMREFNSHISEMNQQSQIVNQMIDHCCSTIKKPKENIKIIIEEKKQNNQEQIILSEQSIYDQFKINYDKTIQMISASNQEQITTVRNALVSAKQIEEEFTKINDELLLKVQQKEQKIEEISTKMSLLERENQLLKNEISKKNQLIESWNIEYQSKQTVQNTDAQSNRAVSSLLRRLETYKNQINSLTKEIKFIKRNQINDFNTNINVSDEIQYWKQKYQSIKEENERIFNKLHQTQTEIINQKKKNHNQRNLIKAIKNRKTLNEQSHNKNDMFLRVLDENEKLRTQIKQNLGEAITIISTQNDTLTEQESLEIKRIWPKIELFIVQQQRIDDQN